MTWLATMLALVTVNAAPEPVAPNVARTPPRLVCPEGAKLIGDPPPEGKKRWCSYRGQDGLQVFHGHYWEWHDNGQLALEGDFVHGIRNGRWAEYNRSGALTIESNYRAGNLDGPYVLSLIHISEPTRPY